MCRFHIILRFPDTGCSLWLIEDSSQIFFKLLVLELVLQRETNRVHLLSAFPERRDSRVTARTSSAFLEALNSEHKDSRRRSAQGGRLHFEKLSFVDTLFTYWGHSSSYKETNMWTLLEVLFLSYLWTPDAKNWVNHTF